MTNKERVLSRERERGLLAARQVQEAAPSMTGTELNAQETRLPRFGAAGINMLEREAGYVCLSPEGRVVRLLQPYDSTVYTAPPEELPSLWGFVWSQDPRHAKPFAAISTSPYQKGDCCTEDGRIYRSTQDGNVHAPSAWPSGWEEVEV